jgi:hypothetical protein
MKLVKSFNWSIVPAVNVVQVDNVNAVDVDMTGMAANVFCVEWREGRGELETTTAPGLRTIFYDVTPYTVFFQRFMTELNGNGAITLPQAQKIQTDLIEVLFDGKRQAPMAFTPTAGTAASWSADDTEVAAMSLQMLGGTGSNISNSLVSQINAMIDSINARIVNVANANTGQFNVMNANVTYVLPLLRETALNLVGGGNIAQHAASPGSDGRGPGSGNFGSMTAIAHIGGPASPTMPWSPIGATTPVNLSSDDMSALMASIASRRQGLLNTSNSKRAAVNALATIAAVIAYDVTAGW